MAKTITEVDMIPGGTTNVTTSEEVNGETIYDGKAITLSPADQAAILAIIEPYLNS